MQYNGVDPLSTNKSVDIVMGKLTLIITNYFNEQIHTKFYIFDNEELNLFSIIYKYKEWNVLSVTSWVFL